VNLPARQQSGDDRQKILPSSADAVQAQQRRAGLGVGSRASRDPQRVGFSFEIAFVHHVGFAADSVTIFTRPTESRENPPMTLRTLILVALTCILGTATAAGQERKYVVLLTGLKSHGPVGNGVHDYGWSARLIRMMLATSDVKDKVRAARLATREAARGAE
jgi:hypothetical protein